MANPAGQSLLRNQYWILRHGRSIPNESDLIVSLLSNGVVPSYGLAPTGFEQAKAAGEQLLKEFKAAGMNPNRLKIYSSPFSRTRQTAEAVIEVLKKENIWPQIEILEGLRERYFGPKMELQSASEHYAEIWNLDVEDPLTGPQGGESVAGVANRVADVVTSIEAEVQGYAVLIVSHGDTLQILQTIVAHAKLRNVAGDDTLAKRLHDTFNPLILKEHRKFEMGTGELRCLL